MTLTDVSSHQMPYGGYPRDIRGPSGVLLGDRAEGQQHTLHLIDMTVIGEWVKHCVKYEFRVKETHNIMYTHGIQFEC